MCWRRSAGVLVALSVLAAFLLLAQPSPTQAKADVPCDVATGPIGAVTGAVGLGNPAGDVCETVTGGVGSATGAITAPLTSPVTGALKGLGNDVFEQLTTWTAEGASWLMGQVVKAIDSSTTPQLETEGFLRSYGQMSAIAAVLAAAMLLFAILEGIAQGSPGLLVRVVLVNVPVAFLGMSLAFVIVQLMLGVTDGLSAAIANVSHHDSTRFFESAIGDLGHIGGKVGRGVGESAGQTQTEGAGGEAVGSVAVPLFVGFLAAIVGAFAAFFVWLELVMRDAAVYAVSLFMPLALAASIWPRWTGALRRSGELLVAVIGSKFVIVAIVSLAASLIAEEGGSVEHVLAAAALMCLACFAPFVLLRLIPFSEGALAAAYGRRSSTGGAIGAMQIGSDVAILRNMGRSGEGSGVALWSAAGGGSSGGGADAGGGGGGPGGGRGPVGGMGSGGAEAGEAAGAGAAAGPATAAAPAAAAARAPQGAAGRLEQTAVAQGAGASEGRSGGEGGASGASAPSAERRRPADERGRSGAGEPGGTPAAGGGRPTSPGEGDGPSRRPAERPPRPAPDAPPPDERPPRPPAEPPTPKDQKGEGR
jgi:hypothetical protein